MQADPDSPVMRPTNSTPVTTRPRRRNVRAHNITSWSREEKSLIYHCFQIARNEIWGRGKMKTIFMEQLRKSEIDKEKLEGTTVKKLISLMSQIGRYLPEDELKNIEESAKIAVTTLINETSDERKEEIFKGQWSVREKCIMLWAISYSVRKVAKPNKERTKVWSEVFYPRCLYKREFDPKKRSTFKNNILKEKLFPEIKLKNWKKKSSIISIIILQLNR